MFDLLGWRACLPLLAVWIWFGCGGAQVRAQDGLRAMPQLEVTIDGRSVSLDDEATRGIEYLHGEGADARYALDVGLTVMVGPERELHFTRAGVSNELLFVTTPGQPPRLVGAQVHTTYEDGEPVLINPLATLTGIEIRGLWGLEIDHWSEAIAAKVGQIDPARTCVTIREDWKAGHDHSLPPLPAGLQILRIKSLSSDGLKNLDELQKLTQLRSLSVDLIGAEFEFDCALLKEAVHLESLDLSGNTLKNTEVLAGLAQLRVLNVFWCRGLTDVSFARSLPKLEVLNVSRTRVADLRPLEGLPALRSVDANMARVRKLPGSVPGLRRLAVIWSSLSDAKVSAFRRANPQCEVRHRWAESLRTALAPATRLRIRSGGTCYRDLANERTLFETNDAAEIRQLLAGIQVVEEGSAFQCKCCGHPSLEFYDKDRLILTLGFHHGLGLRWPDGWPADAYLMPRSAEFLIHWLADRNVTEPLQALQAAQERKRAEERKIVQATTGMPPTLAEAFRRDLDRRNDRREAGPPTLSLVFGFRSEEFQAALVREHPGPLAQVEVWLRIFGTSNGDWLFFDFIDQSPEAALGRYDQQTLAAAVEKALTGTDRQLRRGAARLWMSRKSPLSDWAPPEIARLHSSVLTVQQEARYYPLRMSALDSLAAWKQELSAEEFDGRLAAGLHDPAAPVRRKAMLIAGQTRHDPSVPVLMSVLEGGAIEPWPLPDVPDAEARDVPEGSGDVAPGCSDLEVAALALAWRQHAAARPLIALIKPSTPMLEVSLALLGDGERLKQEHFAGGNQELRLAALEAVVRSKGRHGLQLALGRWHWWEEEYVAGKLSRMLLAEDAPGSRGLADCKELDTLSQWFTEHGAEYLKRLETRP